MNGLLYDVKRAISELQFLAEKLSNKEIGPEARQYVKEELMAIGSFIELTGKRMN